MNNFNLFKFISILTDTTCVLYALPFRSNICLTLTTQVCSIKRSWTPTRIQLYQRYLRRIASDERLIQRPWRQFFLDGLRVISMIRILLQALSSRRKFSRMGKCSALLFIGNLQQTLRIEISQIIYVLLRFPFYFLLVFHFYFFFIHSDTGLS